MSPGLKPGDRVIATPYSGEQLQSGAAVVAVAEPEASDPADALVIGVALLLFASVQDLTHAAPAAAAGAAAVTTPGVLVAQEF